MNSEVALGNEIVLVNGAVPLQTPLGVVWFTDEVKPHLSVIVPGRESPATIVRSVIVVVPDAHNWRGLLQLFVAVGVLGVLEPAAIVAMRVNSSLRVILVHVRDVTEPDEQIGFLPSDGIENVGTVANLAITGSKGDIDLFGTIRLDFNFLTVTIGTV